jgi:chemotaxis protein MotB
MSADKTTPIIIVKKHAGHAAHHGGAWKVAYADFVTAMMALFIVLWLLSSSERVQKAVGGYFMDPAGKGRQVGSTNAGIGETLTLNRQTLQQLKEKLERLMHQMPNFERIKNQVHMTMTAEGLRIDLMETQSGMFFENADPKPTGAGSDLLKFLAEELSHLPNKVAIEGHTDANPYGRRDYSNWELSADRANAARRIMQEEGLRANQVSQVRGFADQRLLLRDEPTNAKNRRISIIVRNQEIDAAEEAAMMVPVSPPATGPPPAPVPAKPAAAH